MTPSCWMIDVTAILMPYRLVAKTTSKHAHTRHFTEIAHKSGNFHHVISELSMERYSERRPAR